MDSISAVILAGGASTRMGRNKAMIEIGGRTLLEIQLEKARRITPKVYVSAAESGLFERFGAPVLMDLYPGQGPLAGLHAAFTHVPGDVLLALACDLPGIGIPLLEILIDKAVSFDAAVPQTADGRMHPLCAAYRRQPCLPVAERCLASGRNSLRGFLADRSLRVCTVGPGAGVFADSDLDNLNNPQDLRSFLRQS